MKKLLIGSAALSALFAGPSMAADITPAPVYSKSPMSPMVPVFGWTGFYIGANAGGHYGTDSTTTTTDAVGWGLPGLHQLMS
jgi:outer membrane immunogenic protein